MDYNLALKKLASGFSMVGLLISLGIVAVVAVVAVPAYTSYVDKAKTQRLLDEATVEQAKVLSRFIDEGSLANINYTAKTPSGETITVTNGEIKLDTEVSGKTINIYLTAKVNPNTNTIGWACSASDSKANLPKECAQDATTVSVEKTTGYTTATSVTTCTGGRILVNDICQCPAGYILYGDTCQTTTAGLTADADPGSACSAGQYLSGTVCICNNSGEPAISGACPCPITKPCLDNGTCRVIYAGETQDGETCSCSSDKQEISPDSPTCRCKLGLGLIDNPDITGDSCICGNSGENPTAIWNGSTCVNCSTQTSNTRPKYTGSGESDSNCLTCYGYAAANGNQNRFWDGNECVACPVGSSTTGTNNCQCFSGTIGAGNETTVACPCAPSTPALVDDDTACVNCYIQYGVQRSFWDGNNCVSCVEQNGIIDQNDSSSCIPCPLSSFLGSTAPWSCTCDPNTFGEDGANNTSGRPCCPFDTIWNGSSCVACPVGSIHYTTTHCVCAPGTVEGPILTQVACTCSSDRPAWSGGECKTCADVNPAMPFWDGSECVACPDGSVSDGSNGCVCAPGTEGAGNETIVACCANPLVRSEGECRQCADANPATPIWSWDSLQCISCAEFNTSVPVWDGVQCKSCYDAYGANQSFWDGNNCVSCSTQGGMIISGENNSSCSPCPNNSFPDGYPWSCRCYSNMVGDAGPGDLSMIGDSGSGTAGERTRVTSCACPAAIPAWDGTSCKVCKDINPITPIWDGAQCKSCYEMYGIYQTFWDGSNCVHCNTQNGHISNDINSCFTCPANSHAHLNPWSCMCNFGLVGDAGNKTIWDPCCPSETPHWNDGSCSHCRKGSTQSDFAWHNGWSAWHSDCSCLPGEITVWDWSSWGSLWRQFCCVWSIDQYWHSGVNAWRYQCGCAPGVAPIRYWDNNASNWIITGCTGETLSPYAGIYYGHSD